MSELQAMHDRMLKLRPEGAEHDEAACPLCVAELLASQEDPTATVPGGSMSEFTSEEVEAQIAQAVEAATAPLKNRITELETAAQETEVGKAVAEAVAAKDAEVSELQSKLDDAEAAKAAALARVEELEAAEAKRQEDEAFAARRAERVAQAAESGVLDEEYLEQNGDRFAAMSDEDFAARLEEWKLIAERSGKPAASVEPPKPSAMQATRSDDAAKGSSALSLIGEIHGSRVRPSNL